jgi:hypothetical protein
MRRRDCAVVCTFAVGVLLATATHALAASTGGLLSASLFARSYSVGAVLDTFSEPPGTSLASTTDACGDQWHVVGGTVTITSGQTAVSSTSGLVTASVPLCFGGSDPNEEAGGDIHSSGSSLFGLLLHARAGGRPATAAIYSNSGAGSLQIERIAADGTLTVWASVTGTGGGNIPRYLDFTYINGIYTASINNVSLLSYTVTAAQRATVEAANEVGLVAVNDTRSTFDNLQNYAR